MNERVMQFRIGMFVIVAGLVLTMMIVWFGESPSLLRDQVYLKVRYAEAPGVLEGVPVRKSGIRIGEVAAIAVRRAAQPARWRARDPGPRAQVLDSARGPCHGSSRSLIGDVTIDMLPGTGQADLATGPHCRRRPDHRGRSRPRPVQGPGRGHQAFEMAGDTLKTINEAAAGLAKLSKNAEQTRRLPQDLDQDRAGCLRGLARNRSVHQDQRGRAPHHHRQPPEGGREAQQHPDPRNPGLAQDRDRQALFGRGPPRRRARRCRTPAQRPGIARQSRADHRLRPERPSLQPGGRRPRAALQPACATARAR